MGRKKNKEKREDTNNDGKKKIRMGKLTNDGKKNIRRKGEDK